MKLSPIVIKKGTTITFDSNELLFLGQSGQPYRGSLYVQFKSEGESFDLQSFKRYITSLRSLTFYSEDIAFEIYTTISESIKSAQLGVIVELTSRGGIAQRLSFGDSFEVFKRNNIFQVG